MTDNTRARVTVITPSDGRKTHLMLPTNVTAGRMLPHLLKTLDLPTENDGGGALRYYLTHETNDGAVQVDADDVLHDIGVVDGTILRITPAMTAGSGRAGYDLF